MNYILVYSDKCKFSKELKNYSIFNELDKIVVNNMSDLDNIPEYITEVPVLIIQNNDTNEISILKENDLLHWIKKNSDNSSKNNQNNQNNHKDVKECNDVVNNFSNEYSFLEENNEQKHAQNYYSNIDYEPEIINITNNNESKGDISKDLEKLMKERTDDFKPIQRT